MQRSLLSLRRPVGFFYLKDPAIHQFMECSISKEKNEHRGPSQHVLKSPVQDRRASSQLLGFELLHLGTVEWRLLKPLLDALAVQSRGCTLSCSLAL